MLNLLQPKTVRDSEMLFKVRLCFIFFYSLSFIYSLGVFNQLPEIIMCADMNIYLLSFSLLFSFVHNFISEHSNLKFDTFVIGLGTDERAIIWILGRRNASQRGKIRETYLQLYKESLIDRLHSELSGDFRVRIIYLLSL